MDSHGKEGERGKALWGRGRHYSQLILDVAASMSARVSDCGGVGVSVCVCV